MAALLLAFAFSAFGGECETRVAGEAKKIGSLAKTLATAIDLPEWTLLKTTAFAFRADEAGVRANAHLGALHSNTMRDFAERFEPGRLRYWFDYAGIDICTDQKRLRSLSKGQYYPLVFHVCGFLDFVTKQTSYRVTFSTEGYSSTVNFEAGPICPGAHPHACD